MTDNPEPSKRVYAPDDPGYEQACQVWNSRYTAAPDGIVYCQDAEEVAASRDWMAQAPSGAAPTIYAMGGAISRVRPEETAFVHRDARFLIAYQSNWDNAADDQTNLDWCEGIHAAMRPYVKGGAYVNIPDRTLADWLHAYYGDNLRRLVEVKRAYDPENVFHFAQSIPLSLPDDAAGVEEEKNVQR